MTNYRTLVFKYDLKLKEWRVKLNYLILIVVGLLLTSCASNNFSKVDFRYNSTTKLKLEEHTFQLPGRPKNLSLLISQELRKDGAKGIIREELQRDFTISDQNLKCAESNREYSRQQQESFRINSFPLYKKILNNIAGIFDLNGAMPGCKQITWFDSDKESMFVSGSYQRENGFKTKVSLFIIADGDGSKLFVFGQPVAPNGVVACEGCSIGWKDWSYTTGIQEAQKVKATITLLKDNINENSTIEPTPTPKTGNDKVSLTSTGSGFVVNKSGIIATNYHVIKSCSKVEVENQEVDILAVDKVNDIAIIKVDKQYENSVYFNIKLPSLAEDVYVYGFPLSSMLGENISITKGIVSSLTGMQGDYSQFRITAPIQAGNSGGPIVNANGEVIGITVSTLNNLYLEKQKGIHSQNVNFGIRSMLLTNMLEAKGVEFTLGATPIKTELNAHEKTTKLVNCFR